MAAFSRESVPQKRMSVLTAIRTIELVLLSAGLIYTVVMIRGSFSTTSSYVFLVSSFKKSVSIFRTWFSSPLLTCIFMNFIVILIAVSSNFHQTQSDTNTGDHGIYGSQRDSSQSPSPQPLRKSRKKPIRPKDSAVRAATPPKTTFTPIGEATSKDAVWKNHQECEGSMTNGVKGAHERSQPEVSFKFSRLEKGKDIKKELAEMDAWTLPESGRPNKEIHEILAPSLDSSAEINMIHKPKEETAAETDDTMEATWMAINGRTKPPEKQLKKSETWSQPPVVVLDDHEEQSENMAQKKEMRKSEKQENMAQKKEMRKSMTFNDTVTIRCRGGLRRDPTMNLEELNHRVETFIRNFNHEMRLQRQESHQRYLDMISQRL